MRALRKSVLMMLAVCTVAMLAIGATNDARSSLTRDDVTVMSKYNSFVSIRITGQPTEHIAEISEIVLEFGRMHPEFTEITLVQVFWVPRDHFAPVRAQDQITGLLITHKPKKQ